MVGRVEVIRDHLYRDVPLPVPDPTENVEGRRFRQSPLKSIDQCQERCRDRFGHLITPLSPALTIRPR